MGKFDEKGKSEFTAPGLAAAGKLGARQMGHTKGFGAIQAASEALRRLGMGLNRVPGVRGITGRIPQAGAGGV